jgi:acetoin utilization deacetylase AcuC-like enzyme
MKIIYARQHLSHDPERMFDNSQEDIVSHYEIAERGERIFNELVNNNYTDISPPEEISLKDCEIVHDKDFLFFLKKLSENNNPGLPDSFSNFRYKKKPDTVQGLLGYYCTDVQTPFLYGTFNGLLYSAGAALTGAKLLKRNQQHTYALSRPPGHHAGRDFYGGFCYCNNAALAAKYLSKEGKTVLLDIDYHHGNGSQDIFYDTDSVFFISLHADPSVEYPYYTGYEDEIGTGKGKKYNRNIILDTGVGIKEYMYSFEKALDMIYTYNPVFIVISFGQDTYAEDPVGKFSLDIADYRILGEMTAALNIPVLIIQEGGYNLDTIGSCVIEFLSGIEDDSHTKYEFMK